MAVDVATMKRLKADAAKAAARASAAKGEVRSAKAQLKQARKLFKVEKKAAKQARKKVDAARAVAQVRTPKGASPAKPAGDRKSPAIRKPTAAPSVKPVSPKSGPKKAKPRAASKPRAAKSQPDTLRSAAEVAKSVIERLHSAPPVLPGPIVSPEPVEPPADAPTGAPMKP
jgi:hypothetical protein